MHILQCKLMLPRHCKSLPLTMADKHSLCHPRIMGLCCQIWPLSPVLYRAATVTMLLACRVEAVLVASQRYSNRATPVASQATASLGQTPQNSTDPAGMTATAAGSPAGRSSLRWHPDVQAGQGTSPGNSPAAQSRLGNMAPAGFQQLQAEPSGQSMGSTEASHTASSPSGHWGRSSLAVQHDTAASPAVSQDMLVASAGSWDPSSRQKAVVGSSAAGRSTMLSLLDSPASFSSSFSSPYGARASSITSSKSKPSSPTKRSHAYRAEQPLRASSNSLPGNASLDAGSWIYIMGSRSSSLAAKQMAKNTSNGQFDRLQLQS